jgi:hypothetical protein
MSPFSGLFVWALLQRRYAKIKDRDGSCEKEKLPSFNFPEVVGSEFIGKV